MVGLITLTWAWTETTLAMTIGIINENAGPIPGHSEAPLSLKRRVKCFRAALRSIAALEPLQEEGSALAERLIKLGVRRNDFIHGAAWELDEGRFESFSLGVKGGDYAVKNHRFDVGDAHGLNVQIANLQDDAVAFMLKVIAIFRK